MTGPLFHNRNIQVFSLKGSPSEFPVIKALEPLANGRNIVRCYMLSPFADTVKLHVVVYALAGSLPLHHFMEHT